MATAPARRYRAFISYSHRDAEVARWLHRAIERYRVPRRLRTAEPNGRSVARLRPVFLDRAELATSADLGEAVVAALEASDALIVVCSPDAARSRWVNDEVRRFKAMGRGARIFPVIVAGRASFPDGAEEPPAGFCFPPALAYEVTPAGEITRVRAAAGLAADLRPNGDGRRDTLLKVVAALLGVGFDELRRRDDAERNRRWLLGAAGATAVIAALAVSLFAAVAARDEARAERLRAERESLKAERTAEFLKSLFAVADPSESRGNVVTVREILDRGAAQVYGALNDQPEVKSSLMTTLGEVYTALGLYPQGLALLSGARDLQKDSVPLGDRLATEVALADARYLRGDYDAAEQAYRDLVQRAGGQQGPPSAVLSRALFGLGETLLQREAYEEADAAYRRALDVDRARHPGADHLDVARSLSGLARSHFYQDRRPQALALFREAIDMRVRLVGENHPRVAEDLNGLASIEYLDGDYEAAERDFTRVLALYRRLWGDEHPDTATVMNNLARVLLEQRKFAQARTLLLRSVEIDRRNKDPLHDDFAFAYDSLGLASLGEGEHEAAERWFREALRVSEKHGHRMLGPTLTNLADLECRRGRAAEGLRLIERARPEVRRTYPDDAWRSAIVDSVEGACLARLGRRDEAARLLRSSYGAIEARWGASRLFTADARERERLLAPPAGAVAAPAG
jgi:tetratricopeptide (TPR) repeat protein